MFAKYLRLSDELDESDLDKPCLRGSRLTRINDVWDALAKLDGDRFSILIVAEGPPTPESDVPYSGKALIVAGGKDNQYLCEAYVKDEYTPTTVRNPEVPVSWDDEVLLKRGELESFPRHQIVDRKTVRKALDAFVKRGQLSDQLTWEESEE